VLRLLVAFFVIALGIAATLAVSKPAPRADLTIINGGDPTTLDPIIASWLRDIRLMRCLHEGLVRSDVTKDDLPIEPALAERWEISPDARTYTFHLRTAIWSDGTPLRSTDFVYAWLRGTLPDSAADYTSFFFHIAGAKEFFDWRNGALAAFAQQSPTTGAAEKLWQETKSRFRAMVAIQTPDEHTLVVTLARPTPYFLDICTSIAFVPLCESVVSRYELVDPSTARVKWDTGWTRAAPSIGAMRIASWQFKREMRLAKNTAYWDAANVHLNSISILSIDDPVSQVMAFQTGGVDWVSDVVAPFRAEMVAAKNAFRDEHAAAVEEMRSKGQSPVAIDRALPADPRKSTQVFPAFGTFFWNLNCAPNLPDGRVNPLADPRVRRALALAIDKRAVAEGVRRLGESTADSLTPPGSIRGYATPAGLPRDPDAARRLLAEAGFPNGTSFPTVELLINKEQNNDLVAQAIAKDWERELGITTAIVVKETKVFRELLKSANYITSSASWFGDYPDPMTFLEISRTGDGNNDRRYSSAAFDALLAKAETETNPAARAKLLADAERILVEQDLPLIPIFHYVNLNLFNPDRLEGISSNRRSEQQLFRVRPRVSSDSPSQREGAGGWVPPPHGERQGRTTETQRHREVASVRGIQVSRPPLLSAPLCLCGELLRTEAHP
jgi:oligopeptide transport system substrate-binding protein